ncbi:TIM barrel protein [Paenibacillus tarimensis]
MKWMRLKTNMNIVNVENRLKYNPKIVEFYLNDTDLQRPDLIRDRIRLLKRHGVTVYLHHPPKVEGIFLDILSDGEPVRSFYRRSSELLAAICNEEGAKCVLHANYAGGAPWETATKEQMRRLKREIEAVQSFADGCFVWEDSTEGLFCYANPRLIDEVIAPLRLPLNVDVSHTFIALRGDNAGLKRVLEATKPYTRYYHLVDSMGMEHDSLPLGQGRIDWRMVKPYVKDSEFIFEIGLSGDHSDCTPMVDSARYFAELEE